MTAIARYCVAGPLGHAVGLAAYSIGLVTSSSMRSSARRSPSVVAASTNFGPDRRWTFAARHHRVRVRVLAWRLTSCTFPPLPAQGGVDRGSDAVKPPRQPSLDVRGPVLRRGSWKSARSVEAATRSDERRPT